MGSSVFSSGVGGDGRDRDGSGEEGDDANQNRFTLCMDDGTSIALNDLDVQQAFLEDLRAHPGHMLHEIEHKWA